jgi:hypothetical protein
MSVAENAKATLQASNGTFEVRGSNPSSGTIWTK